MNIKRISKYYYHRIRRLQGDPRFLAGGTSVGIFVGLTPTIPFHTVAIIALSVSTRTSALAGLIMSWVVCNPLTIIPIYSLSVYIGNKLTPYYLSVETVKTLLSQLLNSDSFFSSIHTIVNIGYEAVIVLMVGGTVLALPVAILSYFISLKIFTQLEHNRNKKNSLRMQNKDF